MAKLSQEEKMKVILRCYYQLDKYIKFPKLNLSLIEDYNGEILKAEHIFLT